MAAAAFLIWSAWETARLGVLILEVEPTFHSRRIQPFAIRLGEFGPWIGDNCRRT